MLSLLCSIEDYETSRSITLGMSNSKGVQTSTIKEDVTDALHKVVWAIDTNDRDLWKSVWSKAPDVFMEIAGYKIVGAGSLEREVFDSVGPLDTQHLISGILIRFNETVTGAVVTANALNQHYPPGMGLSGISRWSFVGSRYRLEMVLEDSEWRIRSWVLSIVWRHGDKELPKPDEKVEA